MTTYQRLAALLVLMGAVGCASNQLSVETAKVNVSVYQAPSVAYANVDTSSLTIDLGQVPVYSVRNALFVLTNTASMTLEIDGVSYDCDPTAATCDWQAAYIEDTPDATKHDAFPVEIPAGGSRLLVVPYAPTHQASAQVVATIASNAQNAPQQKVTVKGTGVWAGAPSIEVDYNGISGPDPSSCVSINNDGFINGCPMSQPLDLGNIELGATGTARLVIKNTAQCATRPGVPECDTCGLIIAPDPQRQNVGLAFKPGTNAQGLFSFGGSTATPFTLGQRDISCGNSGQVAVLVQFNAPDQEGSYNTTIVIESNDPKLPEIEIPVTAYARNAPVAIARLRPADPSNPSAPYSTAGNIHPLGHIYLDGSQSYDPQNPQDPSLIANYQWNVLQTPPGADQSTFQFQGQGTSEFSFWLPMAGQYVVQLTVTNTSNIQSGDTTSSRVTFNAVPGDALHVELTWDDPTNDQDLHLVYASQDDAVCDQPYDCFWANQTPTWFVGNPDANPHLDIDDTDGLGPENINITAPQPATYKIYVQYYYYDPQTGENNGPTRDTVRLWINGQQLAEWSRILPNPGDVWAVASVVWNADGTPTITPYPSDSAGQPGAVAAMPGCVAQGWTFP